MRLFSYTLGVSKFEDEGPTFVSHSITVLIENPHPSLSW